MAHAAQQAFFLRVKEKLPGAFKDKRVLDCGSLDMNGSLRHLFSGGEYVGVDIHEGKNVDLVRKTHELPFDNELDTVVSAEMLEHDEYWAQSLRKMYDFLKPGGLLVISAAGLNRPEHGTTRANNSTCGTSPDYYRNILEEDFHNVFEMDCEFSEWRLEDNHVDHDIYFYGIKA
jgi:SAM-dependent methyltransferase